MDKLKVLMKTLNFQVKCLTGRIFNRGKITFKGNPLENRCDLNGTVICEKNSQIIIGRIDVAQNFLFAAKNGGTLELGGQLYINKNCAFVARKSIKIGDMCSFGPNVCIYDHDHAFGRAKKSGEQFVCSDVVIGNNCWVGANTVILRGTVIGDNCVIGAGCVVKGNIPANSLVTAGRELDIRPIKND